MQSESRFLHLRECRVVLLAAASFVSCQAAQYWTVAPDVRNELRKEKVFQQLVPAMKEYRVSMWVLFNRDPNDDPDNIFSERTPRQDPMSELIGAEETFYPAFFIFTDEGQRIALIEQRDENYVRATGIYKSVRCYTYTRQRGIADLLMYLKQEVSNIDPLTIGLDYTDDEPMADGLTVGGRMILEKALGPVLARRFVSAEMVTISLWGRKLPQEVEYLRRSAHKADRLMIAAFEQIVPGRTTEKDIFNLVRDRMRANGWPVGWAQEICPIVTFHPKADAHPTDAVANPGNLIGLNAGVTTKGYSNDLDRTAYILRAGETAVPPEIQNMWRTLRRSVEAAREAMKPGAIGLDVDQIARKVVTDAGFDEYWYQTGHPVGVWVHDLGPYIGPKHPHYGKKIYMRLQVGDVFAVEPGVSQFVRAAGEKQRVHLQEMIVVTEEGGEYLIPPQEEIILIPANRNRERI
jgi:Xaa-Pro dipeptidase